MRRGGAVAAGTAGRVESQKGQTGAAGLGLRTHSPSFPVQGTINVALSWWCLSCTILLGVAEGEPRRGPSASYLTSTYDGPVPPAVQDDVSWRAEELVGATSPLMEATFVRLSDELSLGDPCDARRVIAVTIPSVEVAFPGTDGPDVGRTERVDVLAYLDPGDGHLAVATAARAEWVLPGEGARTQSPKERIDTLCGEIGPAVAGGHLRIPDLLGTLWRWGINPAEAGQVVMRPRMAVNKWPRRQRGDAWVDNSERELWWFVDARGLVTEVRVDEQPPYWSGRTLIVNDEDPGTVTGWQMN